MEGRRKGVWEGEGVRGREKEWVKGRGKWGEVEGKGGCKERREKIQSTS